MHIIEQYALASSSKIGKPYILTKYFPLNIDKYITFHFASKGAKTYDYADEVVNLLLPILSKENIKIIQIGAPNEKPINGCINLTGQTNFGQIAYLIQNSLLHCGVDSFPVHMASAFDKKLVSLYSSNHTNCVKPYWGNSGNQILLEPDRIKYKPSFSLDESPKSINTIKPEEIAKSVCKLLGFEFSYPYSTLCIGQFFNNKILESAMSDIIDVKKLNAENLVCRMDWNHDLIKLQNQLNVCKCQIICDKPLPIQLLQQYRGQILGVVYKISPRHDPNFVKLLIQNKIPYQLVSDLSIEELNPIKLDYLDFSPIIKLNNDIPDKLKNKDLKNISYKSAKIILGNQKFYPSYQAYINGKDFNPMINEPIKIDQKNLDLLWADKDLLYFLEKELTAT